MGRKRNDEKIQVVNIRMVKEPSIYSESRISCPEDAVKAIAKDMATYDREVFAVMNLKTNGQIINLNICSMGTLDASMVSPREVFKSSILSNAASFIAAKPGGQGGYKKTPGMRRPSEHKDAGSYHSCR